MGWSELSSSLTVSETGPARGDGFAPRGRTAMGQAEHGKSLRCRIGVHAWVTRVNADARWQECGRCGKYIHRVVMANRFPPSGTGEDASAG